MDRKIEGLRIQMDLAAAGDQHRVGIGDQVQHAERTLVRLEAGDGAAHRSLVLVADEQQTQSLEIKTREFGE